MINIHPGEVLQEEFLRPLNISQARLARATGIPPRRISAITHGKEGITAEIALRLSSAFGTTAEFWMHMQNEYDLKQARVRLASLLPTINLLNNVDV